jgi:O-antigen/teichoic acid export membrane protein
VALHLGEHARDTAWALVDQGATLLASTLSFLLLGRTLGATGYGAFVGLYAMIGPFLALGQSGVYLSAMEHIARRGEAPGEVGRSCMSITVLNALLWVPLLSAASLLWIKGLPAFAAVLLIGTEFFLTALFQQSTGIVQVVTGFPAAARLRIAGALLRIALLAILAATSSLTLTTLAVGQAFTMGSAMLFAVWTTSRLAGVAILPGRIRRHHVGSVLLYALQIGASNVQADGDKFVLNAAHHQADAGRYGAASRIMQFALLPLLALVSATHVSFLRGRGEANGQLRRAIRSSLIAMAYGVPAALALFLIAPLAPLVLTRDFSETTRMLQWLAPLVILRGQSTFPMNGLMGLGQNGLRAKLYVGNAMLSVLLYAALIPGHSWRGALAAAFVTELSLSVSGWVALYRCERHRAPTPGEPPARVEGA